MNHESQTQAALSGRQGRIRLSRKVLFSLLIVMFFLGASELTVRILWTPPGMTGRPVGTRHFMEWLSELSLGNRTPINLYRTSPTLLWELTPDRTFASANFHRSKDGEEQPIRISVNPDGYRGKQYSPDTSDLTILCMGDSNFFGYPLDDEHAFPHQLQCSIIEATRDESVQVINGGVPGYTSLQGREWYTERFANVEYDWLLISYINNDAWMQPSADKSLIQKSERRATQLANYLSSHSRLLQFAGSLSFEKPTRLTRRVALDDYRDNLSFFINAAHDKGAQVMILDYCVYPEYELYSEALRRLASKHGKVRYLHVAEAVVKALETTVHKTQYSAYADRVCRRWQKQYLEENELLWFYAEYRPEHLNELGTAWLADKLTPLLTSKPDPAKPQ